MEVLIGTITLIISSTFSIIRHSKTILFFSYRVKVVTKTGQIHEFGMQYAVYTNPNSIDIF